MFNSKKIQGKIIDWYSQTLASSSPFSPYPALSSEELNGLMSYMGLLQRWGAKIDLVSDLSDDSIIGKHLIDSIILSRFVNFTLKVSPEVALIDVGSGAGLPGLVSAILDQSRKHYLVEPRKKRWVFLSEVVRQLKLANVELHCSDLAVFCKSLKINGSIVTHRALDLVDDLLICVKNLISKDSYLVDMVVDKHSKNEAYFNLKETIVYSLPPDNAKRTIVAWGYKA
ncbi:MAG: class I SAM-dependent methyltransferase [Deltaproteobacteria bacterium]|nr:class I SAM-dependent methyltransferase [Deltaproteobacteria bacterium]